MNRRQQIVIAAGAAVVVAMLLFPPFRFITYQGVELNLGYSWLFLPPTAGRYPGHVNVALLLIQWLATAVVCVVLFIVFRDPSGTDSSSRRDIVSSVPPSEDAQRDRTTLSATASDQSPHNGNSTVKKTTKLRLFGAAVLLFNLWLVGHYDIEGLTVLLLTVGFAIAYEFLVVRMLGKPESDGRAV